MEAPDCWPDLLGNLATGVGDNTSLREGLNSGEAPLPRKVSYFELVPEFTAFQEAFAPGALAAWHKLWNILLDPSPDGVHIPNGPASGTEVSSDTTSREGLVPQPAPRCISGQS